jgi:hypothetical protein
MKYYATCPYCESNLDPGEMCDCKGARMEYRLKTDRRIDGMLTQKQIDGLNQARARHIMRMEQKNKNAQRLTTPIRNKKEVK